MTEKNILKDQKNSTTIVNTNKILI